MPAPSISYSITIRLEVPSGGSAISDLTTTVERAGGIVTALDVAASGADALRIDLTCAASDTEHSARVVDSLRELEDVDVLKVSDRTFLMHLGGVIETATKHPLRNRDDLSMIYTPGVARICQAIVADKEDARRLTVKRNSVAVVSDGSAVLGLGNIGPHAALPVMEGKAALFKSFADIDAWPIVLDTQDVDQIVETVAAISPGFAGINLEDISAPRCFEIEARLRERLDIPVFHDDQHGTAVVVLAALRNSLAVVGKDLAKARIVLVGAGAAGTAVLKVLLHAGAVDVTVCDVQGVVHSGREGMDPSLAWIAANTNDAGRTGTLREALPGADVFIGVSAPNLITAEDVEAMAPDSIVFALANPDPEIDPAVARRHAAVVATGRSDYPNQINNVLAFPGIFRGLLDAQSHGISMDVLIAAADAVADSVSPDELNANYVVPSVFHPDVHQRVASAVRTAAIAADASQHPEQAHHGR
ncbi:NAD-dependent malic enzyme [Aeromicrobium sp. SMF47]|uniref:NAD-dependent malic enzyme n=1 Tax=Aeromicrobium yanjiei TaxID=2662028 RepID=A0A5Q2MQK0_9ACTN|nr:MULTISPECIES: NAD-dependent malic enzyme [Aeromicrobium]MRJ75289.1 NAD-dependent malic enzyme [Aeromicrobium yanjiei]MRK02653.1 NAD-dependent malic enzyme [Aeromicrobium sp. S22]QGG43115.1 NAD-dependent malic enzyme [Aeromicrobium yanjiei]